MKMGYSQEVFDKFFNNSIDLLCIADVKGYFLKLNQEWERTLGYSIKELEGKQFIDYVHPDDVKKTIKATEQLADNQLVQNFVNRYQHKDGSYRWIEWRSFPSEGMIFASAHDITFRIEAEQALKESEERNKLITSLTTDYIFRFSVNQEKQLKLVYLSENINTLTRKIISDSDESEKWVKIFDIGDLPKVFSFLHQMITDAIPGNLECRSNIKGETRWNQVFAYPEIDKKTKQVTSIVGAVKDITEKKRTELQLKSSEEMFLKAFLCSPDSVSITSVSSGKYIDVNEVFLKKTGYTRKEIIGKTPLELNLWVDLQKIEVMMNILKNLKKLQNFETEFRMRSGEIRSCLVTGEIIEINNEKSFILYVHDISERKQFESALKESESRYRALIETQSDLVSRYLPDTTLTFVNDAYCSFFGKTRDELIGQSYLFMIVPDYQDLVRNETITLANSGGAVVGEYLNYRFDGKPCWIQWAVQCISDESGHVIELQAVGRDLTERKQSEEILRQSEQKLSDIYNLSPNIVGLSRLSDGMLLDANPCFTTLTGYTRDEFINKTSRELNIWDNLKDREDVFAIIEKEGEVRNFEFNIRKKEGSLVPCFFSGRKLIFNNDPCILFIVNDISEKKNAEIALRESESYLRSFINESSEGIVIINEEGLVKEWNKSAATITGYTPDEIINHLWWDVIQLIAPDDQRINIPKDVLEIKIRNSLKTGKLELPSYDEYSIRQKSGDIKYLQHNIFTIKTDKGYRLAGIFIDITRRIQIENELRLTEEKFSLAFKTSPDSVNINRLSDGLFIEINQGFTDVTGYTFNDVKGKTSLEIDIWVNHADRLKLLHLLKESGKINNMEAQFRCKSGKIRVGLMSANIITLQGEKCILSITRDISERKLAEEQIKRNEVRLKKAQKVGQFGYTEQLINAQETWASADGMRIYGYPAIDGFISNEKIKECTVDLHAFVKAYKELIEQNKKFDIEYPINPADGSPQRYVHAVAELEKDENGKPVKILSIFQDITERKNAENALMKSQKLLSESQRVAHIGCWESDLITRKVFFNDEAYQIYGIEHGTELTSFDLYKNVHPDDRWIFPNMNKIDPTQEFKDFEFRLLLPDGNFKVLYNAGVLDYDENGKPVRAFGIVQDITERKKVEEEIKQLNRELEKKVEERTIKLNEAIKDLEAFAYSVSHDLRAPVRHIDGFLKLLFSKIKKPEESILDYYHKIQEATQRMSVMIDSLLSFSRLGRKELTITEIDLKVLVEEVINQFKPDIGKRNIKWIISDLPTIQGDKNLIKLVLENLISNAIKYTSKRKEAIIEIGLGVGTENLHEFYIKDNGIGFDMAYSEKMFGVFQRLHSSDEYEGIGVGLANVKQIIEKHKGSIRAEGKVNGGAIFHISIPRS